MAQILSMKLHQPALPVRRVERTNLIQRLDEGLAVGRPMTLVSAPAGFGKTTCISEWLTKLRQPTAWLSLDADDNDPERFFSYLAAALKKTADSLGDGFFGKIDQIGRVVDAGQLPPLEVIADALIADITELDRYPGRVLVVLDDFHLIHEPFILKVFERLTASLLQFQRLPVVHLILLTREDPSLPLARLRANNQLTEIRAEDLRFSGVETSRFLNEVMGLNLAERDIAVLAERTEGWIAGLQLAGLSVRGRSDAAGFIQNLGGSHRFILSYLTEEVLNRQAEAVQQFLLDTSILDRLTGDLCRAVTGRTDSHSLLEQLCSANLFLIALDDDQRWYRYHHLFADLLRNRQAILQGERTAELHRRASQWFEQASSQLAQAGSAGARSASGDLAALVEAAVRHALAGRDYAAAVRLIETYAMDLLNQGYSRTLTGWMQALPLEWSAQSPWANLAFARMQLMHGNFLQAGPYLERLKQMFSDFQAGSGSILISLALQAEWLALQSTLLSAQNQPAAALELARQALAVAQAQDSRTRAEVYLALAVAYQALDETAQAVAAYQQLIQLGQAAGNLTTELAGLSSLALLLIKRGQLRKGFELARQGADQAERAGIIPPICAGIYGELGQIYFHWYELEQAETYFQRATQVSFLSGFSDAELFQSVFRSRLALLKGDVNTAAEEIQKAADLMRADAPAFVREEVIAQQVNAALAQNLLTTAEQILANTTLAAQSQDLLADLLPNQAIDYTQGVLYNSALRIILHQARANREGAEEPVKGRLAYGIERAGVLLAAFRLRGYIPHMFETLLLRAQMHAELGNDPASLDDVAEAVDLAEPEGYLSPFVIEGQWMARALERLVEFRQPGSAQAIFIQRILRTFPDPPAVEASTARMGLAAKDGGGKSPQGLIEPLTDRELEVLRLMVEGHSYAEIAGRLVVSINTVRSHIKAIYGKLGVNNRASAIGAAHRLAIH